MYLFLEENITISSEKILLIIDYIHIKDEKNREFFERELKGKRSLNLACGKEKSVVITDEEVYFTSYGTQTLMSRSDEYFNIIGGQK